MPFPGRPQLVFLTFVVVIGTLLLHGLTLPWIIKVLDVEGDDVQQDALEQAAAQTKAAQAAADRLDELMAAQRADSDVGERAATVLRHWNDRRSNSAWEQLGRSDDEIGEGPAAAFKRLRLEMLKAERETFIAERDAGRIDDEVLQIRPARTGPRRGDARPRLAGRGRLGGGSGMVVVPEAPHGVDHRAERPVRGLQIRVGQVRP